MRKNGKSWLEEAPLKKLIRPKDSEEWVIQEGWGSADGAVGRICHGKEGNLLRERRSDTEYTGL